LKKAHLYLLGLLSGLLLTFSWFPVGFAGMIFLAFVPLLIVEQQIAQSPQLYKRTTLFSISYITFFLMECIGNVVD
jgi:apolipoprotein N-acyltransferase